MKPNFFMVPTENSDLGVTISYEGLMGGIKQKIRVAHIYDIDALVEVLQLLNVTVNPDEFETYDHTDVDWLFLEPFMDGDSAFSNIIYKDQLGNVNIIGVIYVAKYQNTILSAIKHSINNRKKVGI